MKSTCLKETEFRVTIGPKDIKDIVLLQNVLRGYIDRKKTVDYTKLKFANKSSRTKKKAIGISNNPSRK